MSVKQYRLEKTNAGQAQRVLWQKKDGGYVLAQIVAVHSRKCRFWRMGKSHGPCTCQANEAYDAMTAGNVFVEVQTNYEIPSEVL